MIVLEQTMRGCGIREAIGWQLHVSGSKCRIDGIDLKDKFVTHGSMKDLYAHYGLDAMGIADYIAEVLGDEN